MTRIRGQAWALILLASLSLRALAASPGVIFQISTDSPLTWAMAIQNIHNLQQAMLPHHTRIEMVVLGPGLQMLSKASPVARTLRTLYQSGVRIDACKKSLLKQGLTLADVSPVVHYVASGIAEIVTREREGWAYIHP